VAKRGASVRRSPLRVLTWHVHGTYLRALAHAPHEFILPVRPGRPHPYGGVAGDFGWPANVREVPADEVPAVDVDVVLHQSHATWHERRTLLSSRQRALPTIVLEHDPPRQSPFDERHPAGERGITLVHVTPFNALMWDSGAATVRVIEHGLPEPAARWTGELARGLVVVNHLGRRGRRLGADIFEAVRERVPLDLIGMGAEEPGGLGEVAPPDVAALAARYRFLFNPIRWTSLGLAVVEALHVGLPVVGLATTEMATAVPNGVAGYVDTDVECLVDHMQRLLGDHEEAAWLSAGAREVAAERFGIERFAADWDRVLGEAVARGGVAAVA
jgi:hypothetical protein